MSPMKLLLRLLTSQCSQDVNPIYRWFRECCSPSSLAKPTTQAIPQFTAILLLKISTAPVSLKIIKGKIGV